MPRSQSGRGHALSGAGAGKYLARVVIEDFRIDYNTRRPHSRLGYRSSVNYPNFLLPRLRSASGLFPSG